MSSIGPDAPGPDLAGLLRGLRHGGTTGPGRVDATAAAARAARLGDRAGDGPAPAGAAPLGGVSQLLRAGVQRWGGPLPLARAVLAAVDAALAGPRATDHTAAGGGLTGAAAGGAATPGAAGAAARAGASPGGAPTAPGGPGAAAPGPARTAGPEAAAGVRLGTATNPRTAAGDQRTAPGAGAAPGGAGAVPGQPGTGSGSGTRAAPTPTPGGAGGGPGAASGPLPPADTAPADATAGAGGPRPAAGAAAPGGGPGSPPTGTPGPPASLSLGPAGRQPGGAGATPLGGLADAATSPPAAGSPPGPAVLQTLLPAAPEARAAHLARAVGWLVENLDRPQAVAAGAAQLGPAAAALGMGPGETAAVAVLLSDAARASGAWPPREWAAWQSAVALAAHWVAEGAAAAGYTPPFWSATVLRARRHGADLAVLTVRTFLPYPYAAGQHATVETRHHRDLWGPCWLAGAPRTDNRLELHVRAHDSDAVSRALVHRVQPGEVIRLGPARGGLVVPAEAQGVLLVAEDTGAAAVRAVREELRRAGDRRPTSTLYWVPPGARPYEEAVAGLDDVTVVGSAVALAQALDGRPELRDWAAVVAGTPTGVAAAATAVAYAGVPAARTSATQIGPGD